MTAVISESVLVTGATGFVGANLVRRLLAEGAVVHIFLREGAKIWRLDDVLAQLQVHWVDLTDPAAVKRRVDAIRPQVIYHLAAYGGYPFQQDLRRVFKTNLEGTINLVEACAVYGFHMFVNTGASSEYGWKSNPMREDEALDPNSYYAIAKAAATHYCRYTAVARKLPIVTLRLFSVYGPWEEPSRFIPTLIFHLMEGRLPPLVSPTTARDFIYIEDVVNAYLAAADRPELAGEVLNVGTGIQRTIREVIDTALALTGIHTEPQWGAMPGRSWDTSVWVADPSKAKAMLGWRPCYDLRAGLEHSFAWFREHRTLYAKAQTARA